VLLAAVVAISAMVRLPGTRSVHFGEFPREALAPNDDGRGPAWGAAGGGVVTYAEAVPAAGQRDPDGSRGGHTAGARAHIRRQ